MIFLFCFLSPVLSQSIIPKEVSNFLISKENYCSKLDPQSIEDDNNYSSIMGCYAIFFDETFPENIKLVLLKNKKWIFHLRSSSIPNYLPMAYWFYYDKYNDKITFFIFSTFHPIYKSNIDFIYNPDTKIAFVPINSAKSNVMEIRKRIAITFHESKEMNPYGGSNIVKKFSFSYFYVKPQGDYIAIDFDFIGSDIFPKSHAVLGSSDKKSVIVDVNYSKNLLPYNKLNGDKSEHSIIYDFFEAQKFSSEQENSKNRQSTANTRNEPIISNKSSQSLDSTLLQTIIITDRCLTFGAKGGFLKPFYYCRTGNNYYLYNDSNNYNSELYLFSKVDEILNKIKIRYSDAEDINQIILAVESFKEPDVCDIFTKMYSHLDSLGFDKINHARLPSDKNDSTLHIPTSFFLKKYQFYDNTYRGYISFDLDSNLLSGSYNEKVQHMATQKTYLITGSFNFSEFVINFTPKDQSTKIEWAFSHKKSDSNKLIFYDPSSFKNGKISFITVFEMD